MGIVANYQEQNPCHTIPQCDVEHSLEHAQNRKWIPGAF